MYGRSIFNKSSKTDAAATSVSDDVAIDANLPTDSAVVFPTDAAASTSFPVAARPLCRGRVAPLYFRRVFRMYFRSIFDTVLNDSDATLQTLFCVD